EVLESQPSITYKNGSAILTSNFVSNSTLIYPSFSISFNASRTLNTRHAYGITNGLCKKDITVGLDAGSTAIETLNKFLENFIKQYSVQDPVVKRRKEAPKVKHIKSLHKTTNIRKEKAARLCSR
ncbi:14962_t:CDS:2, partial [Gigaspora rosea]